MILLKWKLDHVSPLLKTLPSDPECKPKSLQWLPSQCALPHLPQIPELISDFSTHLLYYSHTVLCIVPLKHQACLWLKIFVFIVPSAWNPDIYVAYSIVSLESWAKCHSSCEIFSNHTIFKSSNTHMYTILSTSFIVCICCPTILE